MLGCAISEGLLTGRKCWPVIKVFGENIRTCKNSSFIGASLLRCKTNRITRNNYGTIIRGDGKESRAQRPASHCCGGNSNAGFIQTVRRFVQNKPYEVNTNLPKDVILYKYENPKYFRRLNIFGISQLLFWGYLSHFVYTGLRDVPVIKMDINDPPWWRRINFGERTHRIALTTVTFLVGNYDYIRASVIDEFPLY